MVIVVVEKIAAKEEQLSLQLFAAGW